MKYIESKAFEKQNFSDKPLPKAEYEDCTFTNCDFSDGDLSGIAFTDCSFINCNMSLTSLDKTALRDVKFKDCKMLGIDFERCHDFGFAVGFENCILDHASFYKLKLKKTVFKNVQFHETDFSECDLTLASFDCCDLANAVFDQTVLEKADLRTAINYSIDPTRNRIKKARFSLPHVVGLLHRFDIEVANP
ncbi:MAG: pentapeptide repeat-containing protein [Breznakibacter sp.]